MPSLSEALGRSTANLTPVEPSAAAAENKPPATEDSRVKSLLSNAYKRCPLPPSNNSADSLRQFGQGDQVPVFRTQTPQSNLVSATNGSSTTNVVVEGGGGGSTVVTNNAPLAQNASVTTPALTPGQIFLTTVSLAKAFLMLSVTASAACRVELYGSSVAQVLDQGRSAGTTPPNTIQGLISDVSIVTPANTWFYVDTVGANQGSPQNSVVYVTITNTGAAVTAITAAFLYVSMES